MANIPVKVVDWQTVESWAEGLADRIKDSGYKVDVAIALARGGLTPARLVSDILGIRDIISIKVEHWVDTAEHQKEAKIKYPYIADLSGKSAIIIDDICDTGESFIISKKYVEDNFKPKSLKTAALQYIEKSSKFTPDFYSDTVRDWTWFMYPWNYWEDMINLTLKLQVDLSSPTDVEKAFQDSYGATPPISIEEVVAEIERRELKPAKAD
ncbi:MAG TPA: phosphoribosyltransferase [Candidatus Acidoferrales bacterium]|nr:phosphoribosyltransferase [Candidatus Acidoferrales bacterium]